MKIMYIDCGMGAAGDMLTAALLELLPGQERKDFVNGFNELGFPGIEMLAEPSVKCGITGTHVRIKVNGTEEGEHMHEHHGVRSDAHSHHIHAEGGHHAHDHDHGSGYADHQHDYEHEHGHSHRGMAGIEHIVSDHLDLPGNIKEDILAVYSIIADAESRVHGVPVTDIHFHEVGTMDAIADVTAVCMLMDRIGADRVISSPVNTGSGRVRCAHGILPVPAPATANILMGIPSYSGDVKGELCTPTGAALIKHFSGGFGNMPVMSTEAIGYGMGTKDFETANCVRIMLGESFG